MWTSEQQRVIDYKNGNLLVAAAAGSGKTAVLVERIIKIILSKKADIDKLLVVTFTNAAASEMRERISDAISKELDKNPENTHLQNQVVLLNKASINTIHSFCLDVIKSNFHKININPSFRIGDTTECKILKQEAIEEVFEKFYEEGKPEFFNLVNCYGTKRGDEALQEIIINIYDFCMSSVNPIKWLENSSEKFKIDDKFNFINSIWGELIASNINIELNNYISSMNEYLNLLDKLDSDDKIIKFKQKYSNDYKLIEKILNSLNYDWDKFVDSITNYEFENFRGTSYTKNDIPNENFLEIKEKASSLRDEAKKYINKLSENFSKYTNEIKEEFIYLHKVLDILTDIIKNVYEVFSNKKREKNILDFNDIEHFALNILVDSNGNPSDIAKEYKEKYYEIFIDEYQDSNYVQEMLLSSISKSNTKNRFMVGDVKQSIYRFRQAKPEIFIEKYKNYSEEDSDETKIMLHKNFRSRKEVIDFCNYIFENIMSENVGDINYNEKEKLNLGAVFKENTNDELICDNKTEILIATLDKTTSEENETDEENEKEIMTKASLEARLIGNKIKELTMKNKDNKYYCVYDKKLNDYKKIEYKDIVILLRSTKTIAQIFQKELNNMDIPVFVDMDNGYFETLEIKTIISLLKVIDNPYQDIPIISILKSPIFDFSAQDLVDIKLLKEKIDLENNSFYHLVKKYIEFGDDKEIVKKCEFFVYKLEIYKEKSMYMSTDEFLWYLYTDTGYYYYVGGISSGNQRQANLRILFERAKQFEETSFKGIFNFINFIKKLKKTDNDMGSAKILGENSNVVRIMTIHKSKGLEFPVVIFSALHKSFNKMDTKKTFLYHHELGYGPEFVDFDNKVSYSSISKEALKIKINKESLSEEMRVLYVALTRAKEKLILTSVINKTEKNPIKEWSNGLYKNNKVPVSKVLKSNSYLDWIMISILNNNELLNDYITNYIKLYENNSDCMLKFIEGKDLLYINQKQEEKINILKEIDIKSYDTIYYNKISEKLDYYYPYVSYTKKPSSISVSEIKKIQSEDLDYSYRLFDENKYDIKKPLFIQKTKSKITPAEKGRLIHLIMELIDTTNIKSEEDIKTQINSFIDKKIITEKESKVISPKKILKFFSSDLGKRMLSSEFIKKEQSVYSRIDLKDIYSDEVFLDENDKSIMLRGIVDVYFEENNEIIIIDYKTDYVSDKELIKNKYKKQLELYSNAIENLTGKKVKEKYLYLFNIDEAVKL